MSRGGSSVVVRLLLGEPNDQAYAARQFVDIIDGFDRDAGRLELSISISIT